jgi:hypothetical protein
MKVKRDTALNIHTTYSGDNAHPACGAKRCILHIHTADGGKGYTLHVHTAGGKRNTLHVQLSILLAVD